MIVFRRDRQGRWACYGPTTEVELGPKIVSRQDGQKRKVIVTGLSNCFLVDGVMMRYGYIADQKKIVEWSPKDGGYGA